MGYSIVRPDGSPDTERRGVAFLVADDKDIDAYATFMKLDAMNKAKGLRAAMRDWMLSRDGNHHGYDKSQNKMAQYRLCYNFRCGRNKRFYGFLCHPRECCGDGRFQACIIVNMTNKYRNDTDTSDLNITERARTNEGVERVVLAFYKIDVVDRREMVRAIKRR